MSREQRIMWWTFIIAGLVGAVLAMVAWHILPAVPTHD